MPLGPLPDSVKKLIEAKTYANVATLMKDGSPHVTQTWVDHEGDLVLINTNEGSQKHKNAVRDPRIALDVCDPANPYNMAVIRGLVKEVTFVGAEEHIDKMAKKYLGSDRYQNRVPGVRRVLIKIEATRVIAPWTDNPRWKAWQDTQRGGAGASAK
ncbi:MAG TPA: PPOX class F420-dependent oxidoreductase [Nitrososphaerales archaeon]|nr:PPOX class F420-dependent oxidoreductase [Nitrososphaerales archaeon]